MTVQDVQCKGCTNRVPREDWPSKDDRRFGVWCAECLRSARLSVKP